MGYFIPSSRSQNLRSYAYSGHDGSLLSKYILTPYWNNLVKLFPMSVQCRAVQGTPHLSMGWMRMCILCRKMTACARSLLLRRL